MKKIATVIAILAGFCAAPALAQDWYAGIAFSSTRGKVDESKINDDLTRNLGFFTATTSSDVRDSASRVFAGRTVLPWLDIEAWYAQLGDTKFKSTVTPPGTLDMTITSTAYGLGVVGNFSPVERLKIFGKVGVASVESKANPVGTGFVEVGGSVKERHTSAAYGAGMTYQLQPNIAVRVEYDVHKDAGGDKMGGKFDVQAASIGVQFRF